MDKKQEDILAIYINLINMVNAFTKLQIDFIFSIRNYSKKKKIYEIFLQKMTKLLKGNRLLDMTH